MLRRDTNTGKRRNVACLALLPGLLLSTPPQDMHGGDVPLLTSPDAPGLTLRGERRFSGTALYGHIDGGADLYLEYGFVRLVVQKVEWHGEPYTIEVYEMRDGHGARGISSATRTRTHPIDSIGPLFCGSRYHVQGASGRWFVRVVQATGADSIQRDLRSLTSLLNRKIIRHRRPSSTAWLLDAIAPSPLDVFEARGPLGLQNGYDDLSPVLEGIGEYEVAVLPLALPDGDATVVHLRFRTEDDLATVDIRLRTRAAPYIRRWEPGPRQLVRLEASFAADSLADEITSMLARDTAPSSR